MSVNGSDPNGGCPTDCVGVESEINRCDCMDTRDVTETGFLVDGMVPTINAGQSGGTWASQLYTINGYTLTEVWLVNGSDPNGGCPIDCLRAVSCSCYSTRNVTEQIAIVTEEIHLLQAAFICKEIPCLLQTAFALCIQTQPGINMNFEHNRLVPRDGIM